MRGGATVALRVLLPQLVVRLHTPLPIKRSWCCLKYIKILVIFVVICCFLCVSAYAVEDAQPNGETPVSDTVSPDASDAPAEVTAAPYSDYQIELLTVLGTIQTLLVFFAACFLFWAAYKFFRIFF